MVLSASGACIQGATVEIVGGQGTGRMATQTSPCSVWDWEEAFLFTDLTPDEPVTIQVSSPGYDSTIATVTPSVERTSTGSYLAIVTLELSR